MTEQTMTKESAPKGKVSAILRQVVKWSILALCSLPASWPRRVNLAAENRLKPNGLKYLTWPIEILSLAAPGEFFYLAIRS
jgi:hypothetical protein